jgi:hypothetical protein
VRMRDGWEAGAGSGSRWPCTCGRSSPEPRVGLLVTILLMAAGIGVSYLTLRPRAAVTELTATEPAAAGQVARAETRVAVEVAVPAPE